jgi:hypothetical protein
MRILRVALMNPAQLYPVRSMDNVLLNGVVTIIVARVYRMTPSGQTL